MVYSNKNFFNRELSWLYFNERVLDEAILDKNPLVERLKFIAITSSNLDEFFMIRVAGLKAQIEENYIKTDISGLTPNEQMEKIKIKVKKLVEKQYNCIINTLFPELEKENIFIKKYNELSLKQKDFVENYFNETIFPILTPMAIDASRPFPHLINKSLNIMTKLLIDGENRFSIIQVPTIINRFLELPSKNTKEFILIEDIIKANINKLFTGYKIDITGEFRITRDGDMIIDEDEADDLLIEIENSLQKRKWGSPVRLEVKEDLDNDILEFLTESLNLHISNIYKLNGPLDLTFLFSFCNINNNKNLEFKPQPPILSKAFSKEESIFSSIRKKDIILHHPYDSFSPIIDLIEVAANDPKVLAIKQTLYRVSGDSPIVKSLIKAAKNGKQVTVLVEIKARFDEERNIKWARKLEKSGCHVVYGLKGLKTHAKCLLIVRNENNGIRRYVHFGTGNYNDSTAKLYTDLGFITCKEEYCIDATNLFNKLTGFSSPKSWHKLSIAPEGLRNKLYKLIDKEILNAKEGREGKIIAKMNSLVDKEIIEKLYDASNAGVKITLIIRGACCLLPEVKGLSENIKVYSIVGRYLEHSRIYYFFNNNNPKIYLSSADLMTRNLDRRIETFFPIEDKEAIDLIKMILEYNLKDNYNSRIIKSDGSYELIKNKHKTFNCHKEFYSFTKKNN
ncbi:polyphosphate kinase [Hypnocyclicus thermotrophus]|uniref:Polyphosphate kinase n=1 Tax=Hypnocyclicus thermotrophus TaxID=1627895 RepID=A0AA46DY61_9FUSO|nr:RNA degradosome polyphosphate kinase [Hypnocyclicus thermotrophus]TDT69776.1 polyphosphate kinase [Hypnocyclicus thermotrophus]